MAINTMRDSHPRQSCKTRESRLLDLAFCGDFFPAQSQRSLTRISSVALGSAAPRQFIDLCCMGQALHRTDSVRHDFEQVQKAAHSLTLNSLSRPRAEMDDEVDDKVYKLEINM